ncbi:MAG: Hsp20/alpha crystallin family protein [Firmicutes bacterium]|nr:Hsp20/alpha crystallin family protein [Bacillota bacterium]
MPYERRDLWEEFKRFRDDALRVLSYPTGTKSRGSYLRPVDDRPRVDVMETDTEFVIVLEIPGTDPEKFDIRASDDSISVRVTDPPEEGKEQNLEYYHRERVTGPRERVIDLPAEIEPQDAKAYYENGLLTIRATKKNQGKRREYRVPIH